MSEPEVRIVQADARPLASKRVVVTLARISEALGTLTEVYEALEERDVKHLGVNVFIYRGMADRNLLAEEPGCPMDVGVLVPVAFASGPDMECSATPAGQAATAVHVGPYGDLHRTHRAIRDWCWQNGQRHTGVNWEVYGHWNEDPAQLQTEVFYLLK